MKVLILAGGYGTRLSEETERRPKPMVEIGGRPILWHIMKIYGYYGFNDFVILLGYKGYVIKEYFANYFLHQSDVTINLKTNSIQVHNNHSEPWNVTLLDTGRDTMTGGRILRAKSVVGNESFMITYGDGVSDINISELLKYHREHQRVITMTTVQPRSRYGSVYAAESGHVQQFLEKPKTNGTWVNGGFFVCEPAIFDYLKNGDDTVFESEPLETLAGDGQMFAYKHYGFWRCMDTMRDKMALDKLWDEKKAGWKVWN